MTPISGSQRLAAAARIVSVWMLVVAVFAIDVGAQSTAKVHCHKCLAGKKCLSRKLHMSFQDHGICLRSDFMYNIMRQCIRSKSLPALSPAFVI